MSKQIVSNLNISAFELNSEVKRSFDIKNSNLFTNLDDIQDNNSLETHLHSGMTHLDTVSKLLSKVHELESENFILKNKCESILDLQTSYFNTIVKSMSNMINSNRIDIYMKARSKIQQ